LSKIMASNVLCRRVSNPKSVALVLGPLGSSAQSTMDDFGQLYLERSCTTVTAACPPVRFFLAQHRFLTPIATAMIRETAKALRETGDATPLVVHLFSNGGAFLLEEMELLMSEMEEPSGQSTGESSSGEQGIAPEDVRLIKDRLELQFFDSCPCYLHMMWNVSPYFHDAFPNPAWRPWSRKVYYLGSAFSLTMWCTFTGSFRRSGQFWSRLEQSSFCNHQIYFYTTADMLTDATRIDELIEKRRQELGVNVVSRRYDDSSHCALYKDHPDEYKQVLEESLEGAIQRRKPQGN
jgi:Eukaryotic protein of unknown function (DUF829)